MTFLEVLKRIDECKERVAEGGGPSFQRPDGFDENDEQIWRELVSYDNYTPLTPADIFATDWEDLEDC